MASERRLRQRLTQQVGRREAWRWRMSRGFADSADIAIAYAISANMVLRAQRFTGGDDKDIMLPPVPSRRDVMLRR